MSGSKTAGHDFDVYPVVQLFIVFSLRLIQLWQWFGVMF